MSAKIPKSRIRLASSLALGCLLLICLCSCMRDTLTAPSRPRTFSRDTRGLPEAQSMKIRDVAPGDSLRLVAGPAKKIIDGIETRLLVYGGSFPGPVLRVQQGSRIRLNLVNHTESPTTLHPHGLRLDYRFDGVPNYTQKPIAPGDSFVYQLDFPDPGLYWYHPHVRGDYQGDLGLYGAIWVIPKDSAYWGSSVDQEQILILDDMLLDSGGIVAYPSDLSDHSLMGRFGNTLLINGETDFRLRGKHYERVRFFVLNAANVRAFNFSIGSALMRVIGSDCGRAHSISLANSLLFTPAERGVVEVLYLSRDEYPIEHQSPVKYLTTGPYYAPYGSASPPFPEKYPVMGRILIDRDSSKSGRDSNFYDYREFSNFPHDYPVDNYQQIDSAIQQIPDFTMELSVAMDHRTLPMSLMPTPVLDTIPPDTILSDKARIAFVDAQVPGGNPKVAPYFMPYVPRDSLRRPVPGGSIGEVTPLGIRRVAAQADAHHHHAMTTLNKVAHNDPFGQGIEWYDDMPEMNAASNNGNVRWIMRDFQTGQENLSVRWQLRQGRYYHVRIWNIADNMHPMAHFIHFHGQRSLLLGTNGVPEATLAWKDTFLIGMGKVVDLLIEASNPGDWMAHCHIAEHAEASMMTYFRVD